MKRQVDLERAAQAEAFGALALSRRRRHRKRSGNGEPFSMAQGRAVSEVVRSLVRVAKVAGAKGKSIKVGGVSMELRENGAKTLLSLRTGNRR